jgi:HPt (histidine-containing phosphotransfer) domain-containing protein
MQLEASLLDRELLDEMAALGIADLRDLIEVYLQQATEIMESLNSAIGAQNTRDAATLSHRLAGSSAACGATAVMNSLRTLEIMEREGNVSDAQALFEHAIWQLQASERLLADYLAQNRQSLRVSFVPPKNTARPSPVIVAEEGMAASDPQ